jgi:hypothetical protein
MKVESGGYIFEFKEALSAFVFDETDNAKQTYHGAPMKAVDIIVELENNYLYVEVKNYDNLSEIIRDAEDDAETIKKKNDHQKWLKNYLKYKFRDSYLYRYAEGKVDKPIHYLCLINFDNALNNALNKILKKELPVGTPTDRWKIKLAESCQILNFEAWNRNFPKWQVKKTALYPDLPTTNN